MQLSVKVAACTGPSNNDDQTAETKLLLHLRNNDTPLSLSLTDRCRRTWCIVCVRFAFHHELDIGKFSFQLALIILRIAYSVDEGFLYFDSAFVDDFSNQQNGSVVTHLVEIVDIRGFSKHVARNLRRQNGP